MTDIQILQQSLNGYHLENKEVLILQELVKQLNNDLKNRL
tara:strand:+ start:1725 stop:1844 length:120 start_codon:yes stop_codon:yes gene_type:complete